MKARYILIGEGQLLMILAQLEEMAGDIKEIIDNTKLTMTSTNAEIKFSQDFLE